MRKIKKQKMAGLSEKCNARLSRHNTFRKTCQDIAPDNAVSKTLQKISQVFTNMYFVQFQEV
jgi:hypothetical protein